MSSFEFRVFQSATWSRLAKRLSAGVALLARAERRSKPERARYALHGARTPRRVVVEHQLSVLVKVTEPPPNVISPSATLIVLCPKFTSATAELKFKLKRVQISANLTDCVSWLSRAAYTNPGSPFICRSVKDPDIHNPLIEIENRRARTRCSGLLCTA